MVEKICANEQSGTDSGALPPPVNASECYSIMALGYEMRALQHTHGGDII